MQNALAKANNTAEETISAMKTVRSFANEEAEENVYWQKLQQVYKLNKREAMAYTYYVWSSGVGGRRRGFPTQGWGRAEDVTSDPKMYVVRCTCFSSASRELCGASPALMSAASNPPSLALLFFFHSSKNIFRSPLGQHFIVPPNSLFSLANKNIIDNHSRSWKTPCFCVAALCACASSSLGNSRGVG